jgi:hypothetical protein
MNTQQTEKTTVNPFLIRIGIVALVIAVKFLIMAIAKH